MLSMLLKLLEGSHKNNWASYHALNIPARARNAPFASKI